MQKGEKAICLLYSQHAVGSFTAQKDGTDIFISKSKDYYNPSSAQLILLNIL